MIYRAFLLAVFAVMISAAGCQVTRNIAITPSGVTGDVVYTGKVVSEPFVNKGGREDPRMIDLYFEMDGRRYFIKFLDSNVSRSEMIKELNRSIKVQGRISDGLWDSNNPNEQSRVGQYIIINRVDR